MPREYKAYLRDIYDATRKIEKYVEGISFEDFESNELIQDAVIRNLEIIGEAVKNLPENVKSKYPDIEWKRIGGLRDILIHAYFGVDVEVVWDIVKNKVPQLKEKIGKILSTLQE